MTKIRVVTIVLALLLIASLSGSAVSSGLALQEDAQDDSHERTVTVSGSGQASAQPDVVVVTLGVETQAEEAATALTENSQQMQSLVDVLTASGVAAEDMQTKGVHLYPRYEQAPDGQGPQQLAGYTATNLVEVRVLDLDTVGEILDAAVQAGGNRIEGLRFEVTDPAAYLDQAREAAWNDARHRAEQLAALAGASLGRVLTINESGRGPQPIIERTLAVDSAAAPPIEPGSQTVEVDLQVTWSLEGEE